MEYALIGIGYVAVFAGVYFYISCKENQKTYEYEDLRDANEAAEAKLKQGLELDYERF